MVTRRHLLASALVAAVAGCLDGGSDDAAGDATADGGDGTANGDGTVGGNETADGDSPAVEEGSIDVTSPAFEPGDPIPRRYTREGDDESPPLSIENVPDDAHSLALVVDDPDAPDPPFTHWLCWAILPSVRSIPSDLPATRRLQRLGGAAQGTNDFGTLGYNGPMPPPDDGPHRYRFTVHAVERMINLEPGASRAALDDALEGLILASGRLVGTYER